MNYLTPNPSLEDVIKHIHGIFLRRNGIYMPGGIRERIGVLIVAARSFHDAVRKRARISPLMVQVAAGSLFARFVSVLDNFETAKFVHWLSVKYPAKHCSYCKQSPCICPSEQRPDFVFEPLTEIPAEQINGSLHDWQAILSSRYGDKNKEQGIDNVFSRLVSEIAEVISLQEPQWQLADLDRLEEEYYCELADVFAWICAACSVMDIELQEIVLKLYSKGCSVCQKPQCECKGIILVSDGLGATGYRAESVPV